MLVLERLPQMGASASSTRSSTATKHFILGCRLRSCPQLELKISGSNGGVSEAGVGIGWGAGATFVEVAAALPVEAAFLISRMAASSASSLRSGAASRQVRIGQQPGPVCSHRGVRLGITHRNSASARSRERIPKYQLEPEVTGPQDDRSHPQMPV